MSAASPKSSIVPFPGLMGSLDPHHAHPKRGKRKSRLLGGSSSGSESELNLDALIERLRALSKTKREKVQMSEGEIKKLCKLARDVFLSQPVLLELELPIAIGGGLMCGFFGLLLTKIGR